MVDSRRLTANGKISNDKADVICWQGCCAVRGVVSREQALVLIPDIERSVADMLLRPLFDNNQNMDMESMHFHGAEPGLGQSVKKSWHPGLMLCKTIVSVPKPRLKITSSGTATLVSLHPFLSFPLAKPSDGPPSQLLPHQPLQFLRSIHSRHSTLQLQHH